MLIAYNKDNIFTIYVDDRSDYMLRVAILETEEVAKDIMFELASAHQKQEFAFHAFRKISELATAQEEKEFHIIVFHQKFEIPRITQSFVLNNPQRIVIYMKEELTECEKIILPFARIFYLNKHHIKEEIARIMPHVERMLSNQEEYMFAYNNVEIPLRIADILYIEKEDKFLVYHTKRGEFRERKSMKVASHDFAKNNFLWIHASYLVNMQHITQMTPDTVYLQKIKLPIARARKNEVSEQIRKYVRLR
ncbi:LytTr DNA-binding domain protein [Amedibacillus dolichus DSM 3991]|jgi:hypothetical protein|nr:LytTr DNA-binding domain protein [Amedibacillus dolichus DSM 3991]